MHSPSINPTFLLVGGLASFFLVRAIRSGSVSYRYGKVSRDLNPLVFWIVAAANALIAVAALLMGLGIWKK